MYSIVTYTGNGVLKLYSITFPYIQQSDVEVYIDDVLMSLTTDYTFPTSTSIQFVVAPVNNSVIKFKRNTNKSTALVNFTDGSILTADNLDLGYQQMLYVSQEIVDDYTIGFANGVLQLESPTFTGTVSMAGALAFTGTGSRITGDMSNATASNRMILQSSTTNGSSTLGIAPNGSGAAAVLRLYSGSAVDTSDYITIQNNGASTGIVTAANGGTAKSIAMRPNGANVAFFLTSTNTIIGASSTETTASEKLQVQGAISATLTIKGGVYNVAALPTGIDAAAGVRAFVNDANATTFASIVAGGGANVVPVYSDGTNWRIG